MNLITLSIFLAALALNSATNFMTLDVSSSTQSSPFAELSPFRYGVNTGHKCVNDDSWVAFTKYLGAKYARIFGLGGAPNKLNLPTGGVGSSVSNLTISYGSSLSGVLVRLKHLIIFMNIFNYYL